METIIAKEFRCKKCGMCCRNVKRYKEKVYPELKTLLGDAMPDFCIEDINGVCVFLRDNICSIYETRPIICNTDKMFTLISRILGVDKNDLIIAQSLSCKINKIINK